MSTKKRICKRGKKGKRGGRIPYLFPLLKKFEKKGEKEEWFPYEESKGQEKDRKE